MSNNLLAVSGGADSMYLLCHFDGIVAHFNHKMRADSDSDAKFVWDWCQQHDRVCVIGEAYEPLHSEMEAREARYAFLQETARDLECDQILTAHNMNDNAETVLLNLIRGAGLKGLCGIPEKRDNIVRPMLNVSRDEIEKYLLENNIPHVEDSTNQTDLYTRNIIRHKIIPELLKINPNFIESVYHTTQLLKQDNDYLEKAPLSDHPAIISRYIINNSSSTPSYKQIQSILNLNDEHGQVDIHGSTVYKDRGKIYFSEPQYKYNSSFSEVIVNNELTKDYADCGLIKGKLYFDTRKPGDKYRPLGRNCTKTLKSLFIEADLNQWQRDLWPIARDDEGIVWVYKFGVAERVATKKGNKAIKFKVEELYG